MKPVLLVVGVSLSLLAACGGGTSTPSGGGGGGAVGGGGQSGNLITISAFAFSPQNLTVPAGATVQIVNDDSGIPHTVTSSVTSESFSPGAVNGVSFDSGDVAAQGQIQIPASAPSGTVIPYYCRVHLGMMVNRPTITVQ